ncbi:Ltp family lipoprotein [Microbacterium sp. LRZ72]|uniref:Ltp family lipoprotein n=1 Tax=Microbacterium sp. LRZ72 TaxID=2942481 RepID=UPI0029A9F896|nr:Ltp family lipoprotein [Microbacterium sp. LRZ72]MDX2377305.1 Ltp family lipoprotein [Microbacterium sp. LRZ72]
MSDSSNNPSATPADSAVKDAPAAAAPKRPWYKRKAIVIPLAVVAGIIVISGIGGAVSGGDDGQTVADPSPVVQPDESTVVEDEPEPEPVMVAVPDVVGMDGATARATLEDLGIEVSYDGDDTMPVIAQDVAEGTEVEEGSTITLTLEEKPQLTLGQENAIRSAQSYLDFSAFSRAGLFDQLTSEYGEGFEAADAEFALAHLEENGLVDWDAEAVESAESYLEFSSFSRQGLYEQLTSEYGESFTAEQAEHALDAVGY